MESKVVFAVVGIVILCILAYVFIMVKTPEEPQIKTTTTQPEETQEKPQKTTTQPEDTSPKALSEIQVDACNAADEGGTCYTRLQELGIVTPEECCQSLGKCCV